MRRHSLAFRFLPNGTNETEVSVAGILFRASMCKQGSRSVRDPSTCEHLCRASDQFALPNSFNMKLFSYDQPRSFKNPHEGTRVPSLTIHSIIP